MKKIVNGKLYDTDTAKRIDYCNEYEWEDYRHYEETLYQTEKGAYFIYGYGGAASKYRVPIGDRGFKNGTEIIPLTELEAKAWGEKHMDADTYIETFGEVETA